MATALSKRQMIEALKDPHYVTEVAQFNLDPKQSQLIKINGPDGMVPGDHAVATNGLTPRGAFRVTSTVPRYGNERGIHLMKNTRRSRSAPSPEL